METSLESNESGAVARDIESVAVAVAGDIETVDNKQDDEETNELAHVDTLEIDDDSDSPENMKENSIAATGGVSTEEQSNDPIDTDPNNEKHEEIITKEAGIDPTSNCKFYMKTGACKFGSSCSRTHARCEHSSNTIIIQNFFNDYRMERVAPQIKDEDDEFADGYDEVEMMKEYRIFYDGVIREFRTAGKVIMFKCSHNHVEHLRGNVYVEYARHEEALKAVNMFNAREYDGRQLEADFSPVANWKAAICGLCDKRACPRGHQCTFLHVFRNPGNAYNIPNLTDFDPERAPPKHAKGLSKHPVFKYYKRCNSMKHNNTSTQKQKRDNRSINNNNNNNNKSRSRNRSRSRSTSRSREEKHGRSEKRNKDTEMAKKQPWL